MEDTIKEEAATEEAIEAAMVEVVTKREDMEEVDMVVEEAIKKEIMEEVATAEAAVAMNNMATCSKTKWTEAEEVNKDVISIPEYNLI